jgi:polyferredoxin
MIHQGHTGLLADAILILHVIFAAFILLGLILIIVGGIRQWSWIRNPLFRLIHLLAIWVVVVQAWCGVICPLTTWEMILREMSGQQTYKSGFIAHWLQRLLYYDAPQWVFVACYTIFGIIVIASWIAYRPRRFTSK